MIVEKANIFVPNGTIMPNIISHATGYSAKATNKLIAQLSKSSKVRMRELQEGILKHPPKFTFLTIFCLVLFLFYLLVFVFVVLVFFWFEEFF